LRTGKHEFDVSFHILFLSFKFPVSSSEGKERSFSSQRKIRDRYVVQFPGNDLFVLVFLS